MNDKQAQARSKKMRDRAEKMLAELWPLNDPRWFWDPSKAKGYTRLPRTLIYVMNIIDALTKGKPAGQAYLAIWCRLFETGIVELPSEKAMAQECGFGGKRAVDTWRQRMRSLKELRFIDYKPGNDHEFQWTIVCNPHFAILNLGGKVQQGMRAAWMNRALEIGATDLELPPPIPTPPAPEQPQPGAVPIPPPPPPPPEQPGTA